MVMKLKLFFHTKFYWDMSNAMLYSGELRSTSFTLKTIFCIEYNPKLFALSTMCIMCLLLINTWRLSTTLVIEIQM